jgi:TM2 domain-containing membrane protein YozV
MKRHPTVAGLLSLLIPGLGQIYCGEGTRGAAIMVAAIIIGNLNLIFLPVFVAAKTDPELAWAYWLPRIGHDLMSLWSLAFWIWVILDAAALARKSQPGRQGTP